MNEKGLPGDDRHPKYGTRDPLAAFLVSGFLNTLDRLVDSVPREPLGRLLNILRGFFDFLAGRLDILKVCSPLPWTMVLCQQRK